MLSRLAQFDLESLSISDAGPSGEEHPPKSVSAEHSTVTFRLLHV